MKLKAKLEVWGRTVMFQVIEMDEGFRATEYYKTHIITMIDGPFKIISSEKPGVYPDAVNLRGRDRRADDHVSILSFPTEAAAKSYIARAKKALVLWGKDWGDWKGDKDNHGFFIVE